MYRPILCLAAVLLVGVGFVLPGCDAFSDPDKGEKESTEPLFVKGTPLIAAALEASPDRGAYYYPTEVFVGTIFDPEDNDYNPFEDPIVTVDDAIYSPTLFAQVIHFMGHISTRPDPDPDASVVITGPLSQAEERVVALAYKPDGVYYDAQEALTMQAGARYRLDVTLSDGRHYQSKTQIPTLPRWNVPDTVSVNLALVQRPGEPVLCTEENNIEDPEKLSPYEPAEGAVLTVAQQNYSRDWAHFGVPTGEFRFEDRGHHRREGGGYGVYTESFYEKEELWTGLGWFEPATPPVIDHLKMWLRLSQLDPNLSQFYWSELGEIYRPPAPNDDPDFNDPVFDQYIAVLDAIEANDANHFFDISNIEKLDENGNVLPTSDAVGVFGSYSSLYPSTTIIPIRSWDPDTLDCK